MVGSSGEYSGGSNGTALNKTKEGYKISGWEI
jgi:hypothetical protein